MQTKTRADGAPRAALPQDQARTMPLLADLPMIDDPPAADAMDMPEPALQASLLGRTSLLLLIVAVVVGGTLLVMRGTQGELTVSEAAKAVEDKVEQALARLAGAKGAEDVAAELLPPAAENTSRVVAMFEGDPSNSQVPLTFLKKNPFVQNQAAPPPPPAPKAVAKVVKPTVDRRAQRIAALKREVGKFQVQTVIQGSTPMAIVNGEIVKPGQRLGSFSVAAIDSREVRLVADDMHFVIRMER